jgi:hypothetical protein
MNQYDPCRACESLRRQLQQAERNAEEAVAAWHVENDKRHDAEDCLKHNDRAFIEQKFREGIREAEAPLGTPNSPYGENSLAAHWWTRGFAYTARNLRAIAAEQKLAAAEAEIVQLQQQIATLADAAGERESIASLVADREEMTVYLKVEAALKELESREAEIVQLRQEKDRAWEWYQREIANERADLCSRLRGLSQQLREAGEASLFAYRSGADERYRWRGEQQVKDADQLNQILPDGSPRSLQQEQEKEI